MLSHPTFTDAATPNHRELPPPPPPISIEPPITGQQQQQPDSESPTAAAQHIVSISFGTYPRRVSTTIHTLAIT